MNILVTLAAILIISVNYAVLHASAADRPPRTPAKQEKESSSADKGNVAMRMEQGILQFTNEVRRNRNLAPVKPSEALRFLASTQSSLLCKHGLLEHESDKFPPQWRRFSSRMQLVGVKSGAENIAYRTIARNPLDWARDIVNGWMNSPAHKKNILDPRFLYMGVGVQLCKNNIAYVAQVFSPERGRAPQGPK